MDVHTHVPQREPSLLVQGHYLYFHYNQQGVTDKGWGCAYRSLQTVISFFVLNHYYALRVPTIPEACVCRCREG